MTKNPRPNAVPSLQSVRRISRWMVTACWAILLLLPLALVGYWATASDAVLAGHGNLSAGALAPAAARRGKRTMVLTIDPARRLANSLGPAELGHEVQQVDPALVRREAPSQTGELHAMMLDQKRAFDEMVASHAKDPAAVKRIVAETLTAFGLLRPRRSATCAASRRSSMSTLRPIDGMVVVLPKQNHYC